MSEVATGDWTWINAVADRFERAWKHGLRPRIEDFLAEVAESRWPPLLEELLRVEGELRRRAGEEPSRGEYKLRFSQHVALIEAVFGPEPHRSVATGPRPDPTTTAPVTPDGETDGDLLGLLILQSVNLAFDHLPRTSSRRTR